MTDKPLRIVFCLDAFGVGGTEMNALRLAEHLDPSRFEVAMAVLRTDGPLRTRFEAAGVKINVFPATSIRGPSMITEGRRFVDFLRRNPADIVHAHDRYSNMFAVPWARVAGVPGVIASRRWDTMSLSHSIGNRVAYKLAHLVLGNSTYVGEALVAAGVPRSRVVVVSNFVDEQAFELPDDDWVVGMREQLALAPDALVVGILASLRSIKDHPTLLRAVAVLAPRFPKLVLVLMGTGPDKTNLERLALELGIAGIVRFAGSQPNLPNPHRLFDVSVLCSLSEGFPNTIVEAMAAARPVVATRVGGVPDAVTDGVNGLLTPARDVGALATALERLLLDGDLRTKMGAMGQRMAREQFTAAGVLPGIEQIYTRLAATRRR
ncbi:MAG: glycosyltransferase [bacterium]